MHATASSTHLSISVVHTTSTHSPVVHTTRCTYNIRTTRCTYNTHPLYIQQALTHPYIQHTYNTFYIHTCSTVVHTTSTHLLRCVGGPGPDDWVLEDLSHDGSLYLVDPKTDKLFTVPSGNNSYPRPVGEFCVCAFCKTPSRSLPNAFTWCILSLTIGELHVLAFLAGALLFSLRGAPMQSQ